MSKSIEIKVPDIGDYADVPVIEVLVAAGDAVDVEDPLVTLESDKATMDVPATHAGVIEQIHMAVGDTVSEGSLVATLRPEAGAAEPPPAPEPVVAAAPASATQRDPDRVDLVVLGSGPGGYTAAFRAADLGLNTVLVERYPTLGGVCLNVGCIPSKALLHAARVITEARDMAAHGISFGDPQIDLERLRGWKEQVVGRLTDGLAGLAKQRKVRVIEGQGRFASANHITVDTPSGTTEIDFANAIIAVGSQSTQIPTFPHDDPRVFDSTDALALGDVPPQLLVVGGGIIGLEMATVYHELGSKVTVVELLDTLIPGADPDIVRPLHKRIEKLYDAIYLKTKVVSVEPGDDGLTVTFDGDSAPPPQTFDKVLVAVGRQPNGNRIYAAAAGVRVDERGFIPVDRQQRTNVPHIYAIGDVVGQPMLAHKAVHEGKVAAEVAAGLKSGFDARVIPSVAYTDPEVAWVGVTEGQAKREGIAYGKGVFPWAASGRALSLGRSEGVTKVLFDEATERVIGAGIVGTNAGDLIAEAALAIEMGSDAQDIGLTVHPHPTLSETVGFAAEAFEGTITDLYMPKKKTKP